MLGKREKRIFEHHVIIDERNPNPSQLYAHRRKLDYTVLCLEKNKFHRGICAFGTDT